MIALAPSVCWINLHTRVLHVRLSTIGIVNDRIDIVLFEGML